MNLDRSVFLFAGCVLLLSVALTHFVSGYFVWLTVFVGVNLIQSAFTGFCPAALVLKRLGLRSGCAFS